MYMSGHRRRRAARAEEVEQQVSVERYSGEHRAVRERTARHVQRDQRARKPEAHHPYIEAHADPAERFGVELPDGDDAQWNADKDARHDPFADVQRLDGEQAELPVRERRETGLGYTDEREAGAKFLLHQALVVEK